MIIREHLDRSSNPSVHPHYRSYRTLWDGSFGVRCPRHFVSGYDRAVPPGHLPVALTPPSAHGTSPISDQTVSYTCGTGTLRPCVPGVRVALRSLTPDALSISEKFPNRLSENRSALQRRLLRIPNRPRPGGPG